MKRNTKSYISAIAKVGEIERKLSLGENKWGGFNKNSTRLKLEALLKKALAKEQHYESLITKEEYQKYFEADYAQSWREFKNFNCFVKFLDCKNKFKVTEKDFKTEEDAWQWVVENFEKPSKDFIYYY
jgi:hypothetical protein